MGTFAGEVKGKFVDVRFGLSGKVSAVKVQNGDVVKKWDLLASLDRKVLQAELDRQLADFEKTRADFEVFNQKNPNPQSDLDKYLKVGKQADLNASVKEVELSKMRLDMCDLVSPVDGVVIDDGGIVSGLFITPSNSPLKIFDVESLYFEFEVEQKDVKEFAEEKEISINFEELGDYAGKTKKVYADGKKFIVKVLMDKKDNLLPGMKGNAKV